MNEVKAARGKYVVNANADDGRNEKMPSSAWPMPWANPGASIAYGDIVYSTQPNDTFPSEHVTRQISYPDFHPGLAFACCFAGCTQFWRQEDLIRIGCFDARYKAAGDYEILLGQIQHGMIGMFPRNCPFIISMKRESPSGPKPNNFPWMRLSRQGRIMSTDSTLLLSTTRSCFFTP